MSKKVHATRPFNKEEFLKLLKDAMGTRTQAEFARESGLSAEYISRQFSKTAQQPRPIPSTLEKIAAASTDSSVSLVKLLYAAGYNPAPYLNKGKTTQMVKPREREFNGLATGIITTALSKKDLEWTMVGSATTVEMNYDFKIEIKGARAFQWCFECPPVLYNASYSNVVKTFLEQYFGRLTKMPLDGVTKLSFITASESMFNGLLKPEDAPRLLAIHLSVILVNPETFSIVKEEYIQTALSNDDGNLVSF